MSTPLLTGPKLLAYAQTRLFGTNISPADVQEIVVHNGILPSELRATLGSFDVVQQVNPREPIYFKEGVLHIPQYSGFGRELRYTRLIDAYIQASGHQINGSVRYRTDEPHTASVYYGNFAYDLLKSLFRSGKMEDVTAVIFGSTKAVQKKIVGENVGTEYLDAQLIDVEGKKALNLGYVYADQAKFLTDRLLRWFYTDAQKKKEKLTRDIFMFGRVGGLAENIQRHDLVYPDGIINQADLEDRTLEEKLLVTPMHNILANENGHRGWNLNVMSVLDETKELLEKAKEHGCICTEMETFQMVSELNLGRTNYRDLLNVEFGFVGYVSDNPLRGDTLDVELDSDNGEQQAVQRILEKLRQ